MTTFTVDPADAKGLRRRAFGAQGQDGVWEIGVHIADVTHYVRPNRRSTTKPSNAAPRSIWWTAPCRCCPNGFRTSFVRSRPHETSLCFSAVFTLNENLDILEEWFRPHGDLLRPPLHLCRGAGGDRDGPRRLRRRDTDAQPAGAGASPAAVQERRDQLRPRRGEIQTRRDRQTAGRLFQGAEGIEPDDRGVHAAGQPPRRGVLRQTQDRQRAAPSNVRWFTASTTRRARRSWTASGSSSSASGISSRPPKGPCRGQGTEQAFRPDQGHDRGERRIDDGRTVDGQGVLHDRQHRPLRTGIPLLHALHLAHPPLPPT